VPSIQGKPHFKFTESLFNYSQVKFSFLFSFFFLILLFAHLIKITAAQKTHSPFQLKFGTFIKGPKASLIFKFGANLMKISRFMKDFISKTMSNFCHAYRLNQSEEHIENQYAARFNIRGVPLGG